jgi:hypothetical protein
MLEKEAVCSPFKVDVGHEAVTKLRNIFKGSVAWRGTTVFSALMYTYLGTGAEQTQNQLPHTLIKQRKHCQKLEKE